MRALLLAVIVLLAAAPSAAAAVQTASSGTVSATLDTTKAGAGTVTVTRAGTLAYDAPVGLRDCRGGCMAPDDALVVRDLDADGDPEVVISLFTGGAHCCSVTRILRWDGARYVTIDRNFGNAGFRIEDVGGGVGTGLVTGDDRFSYLYGAYAFSVRPIQVLALQEGRLVDVTRMVPAIVRQDAAKNLKLARASRMRTAWAAWAADQYLLDRRTAALRTLRRQAARGNLRPDVGRSGPRAQRRFVQRLDRDLRRFGYLRTTPPA